MDKETNGGCFKMRIIEYHDFKTLMGPCFISFSLPLLIPGVVLTVVGSYGNEHTFSRFGAWHISGIVILSFAVIMLLIGVVLKCFYRPTMSADIEQHLSPNTSVITGSRNIGYDKDKDDDNILNSKGTGNRISPENYAGKHKMVSTHEKRHRTHSESKALSNGVVVAKGRDANTDQAVVGHPVKSKHKGLHQDITHDSKEEADIATTIHVKQGVSHRNVTDSESEHSDRRGRHSDQDSYTKRDPPPSYDDIEHHRHSRQSKRSRSKQSLVKDNTAMIKGIEARAESENTVATATMTAEVTSHQSTGNSPRDRDSSDAKEETRFLPEKKKRKKKKRVKRRQSELSETAGSIDDTPRTQLPALRLKPVLLHEGEPHHHQQCHVHFQTEASSDSLQGISSSNKPGFSGQGVEIELQQTSNVHTGSGPTNSFSAHRENPNNSSDVIKDAQDSGRDKIDTIEDETNAEFYV